MKKFSNESENRHLTDLLNLPKKVEVQVQIKVKNYVNHKKDENKV